MLDTFVILLDTFLILLDTFLILLVLPQAILFCKLLAPSKCVFPYALRV